MAEPVADDISVEQVLLQEDYAVQTIQPLDFELYQEGDSLIIIANGQRSAFFVPADSKAGRGLGYAGIILALVISLITWYKQTFGKHRLSGSK